MLVKCTVRNRQNSRTFKKCSFFLFRSFQRNLTNLHRLEILENRIFAQPVEKYLAPHFMKPEGSLRSEILVSDGGIYEYNCLLQCYDVARYYRHFVGVFCLRHQRPDCDDGAHVWIIGTLFTVYTAEHFQKTIMLDHCRVHKGPLLNQVNKHSTYSHTFCRFLFRINSWQFGLFLQEAGMCLAVPTDCTERNVCLSSSGSSDKTVPRNRQENARTHTIFIRVIMHPLHSFPYRDSFLFS